MKKFILIFIVSGCTSTPKEIHEKCIHQMKQANISSQIDLKAMDNMSDESFYRTIGFQSGFYSGCMSALWE